jgi:hypothetical protein
MHRLPSGVADLTAIITEKNMSLINEAGGDMTAMVNWCPPAGVTPGQLLDVMIRELHAHPEDRHLPALPLVIRAFITSFPCR